MMYVDERSTKINKLHIFVIAVDQQIVYLHKKDKIY